LGLIRGRLQVRLDGSTVRRCVGRGPTRRGRTKNLNVGGRRGPVLCAQSKLAEKASGRMIREGTRKMISRSLARKTTSLGNVRNQKNGRANGQPEWGQIDDITDHPSDQSGPGSASGKGTFYILQLVEFHLKIKGGRTWYKKVRIIQARSSDLTCRRKE